MSESPKDKPASENMAAKVEASNPPGPPSDIERDGKPMATPAYTAFSPSRRTFILTVVTVAGFFGPLAGNIYLPALPVLTDEFNVSTTAMNSTVSVFMVVFAFGIVEPKKRARAMSYFLLGPQCGPILGPVLGGAFAGQASWRWIFGFLVVHRIDATLAISAFVLWLVIIAALPETLRARVGNGKIFHERGWILWPPTPFSQLAPESERGPPPPKPTLKGYWQLFKYPPIGIVCFDTAILYSSYFCIAIQLPTALQGVYHWSTASVGAGYLVVGIAMVIGSVTGGHFSDWRRARLAKTLGEKNIPPETRLIDQIWGVLLLAAGLLMFGWFVDRSIHPAATLVSTFLTGFGMSWTFVASNAFLTECVAQQAAGAFALGNMLRSPGAAIAAAIIAPLVTRMGWGWCFTGLSILNLVVVGAAVIVLRVKSPYWRKKREAGMASKRTKA
ncbi:predicted protein [Uncinocarpus reesii 1704]|uniref:Major facilitator superfamily (MFS) profile domain-containing protein n=1 Tax=Uncinocarpus reesii (strain UAMH 1704) TaxID=336963 RepID=C4JUV6_UNCRE|nr:uncharacterized protein UREG_04909 [Uncinocarpus reesii 1704]EEP80067.1 predicted protein [Uncinocarpus reesii 1704]